MITSNIEMQNQENELELREDQCDISNLILSLIIESSAKSAIVRDSALLIYISERERERERERRKRTASFANKFC